MFMISLKPYSLSNFLLVPLFHFSFFDIYCNHSYIFLYFLLLLAASNFLLPTLLFFTFLHILLLVHYNIARLFLFLAPYSLTHKSFPSSICYLFPHNTFPPTFFISSTTLTISSSLPQLFLFFLVFLLQVLLLLLLLNYKSTFVKLQIYCSLISVWFLLFFSIPTFQSGLLLSPSTFIFVSSTFLKIKLKS